jgi:RimJ/RimL family protein N-acetyltransferase
VHINWKDRYAEISFIINTALEKDYFQLHWTTYLSLIEQVAFEGLKLHKIFTYAYDLRPHLYKVVEAAGFKQEARLKEHCFIDGNYFDVVIHSKINN